MLVQPKTSHRRLLYCSEDLIEETLNRVTDETGKVEPLHLKREIELLIERYVRTVEDRYNQKITRALRTFWELLS